MIRELIVAGQELAGGHVDPHLRRGLLWASAETVFATLPYGLLWWLLRDLMQGRVPQAQITTLATGMLSCLALRIICARQAMPATFTGAYATMGRARLRLADHLRKLPLGWFEHQRSGAIAGTLISDLQQVEDTWAHFLGVFFGGLLVPVLVSALLLVVDWRLGTLVVAMLPLAFAALALTQHVLGRLATKLHTANAQGHSEVLDYVQGIAVVRAFGGRSGGLVFKRLARSLAAMHRRALAIELWPTPLLVLFGFTLEAGFALTIWAGAQRLGHDLDGATLLLFAVLALPIYRQLFEVGLAFIELRYTNQTLQRLRALLSVPCMPEPAQSVMPTDHDIAFDDVHFSYVPGEPVLRGICCTLPSGSITAVVGPSGAGKSTLVHLIARLWEVKQGAIRIGGKDLRTIGSRALHQQVATVFQDVRLFSGSLMDNIRLGRPAATRQQVEAAARQAGAHDFIAQLPQGYDTVLGENGAQLSGGERQRISIARALLLDAPILLLDEATASIDATSTVQIQQALSVLAQYRTVVVIAHRLRTVRSADQILVLDDGRLVEQGQHDELLARDGLYTKLWTSQERAAHWHV